MSVIYLLLITLRLFMKKLQLLALFFAASATDIFAGKTVRNSAEQPTARKQYLAIDRSQPTQREIASVRAKSERIASLNLQKASQKPFEDKK